jgi:hypothetical protein
MVPIPKLNSRAALLNRTGLFTSAMGFVIVGEGR